MKRLKGRRDDRRRAKRWPAAVIAAALLCGLAPGAALAGKYTITCPAAGVAQPNGDWRMRVDDPTLRELVRNTIL